ncbi:MAG: type III-B CRISPR module RAMP protein Cmr4 [Candidatus Lokiarchaeota archaeon]|nr:type III-B CRISPR module RAMP protein Cmr4 [Candidatus Lokiarchaeota archaeon]
MYKKIEPMFYLVRTPLHMGSGTELGVVDLPIQRECHTTFPKMEASGIKGAIRHVFKKMISEGLGNDEIDVLFGPEDAKDDNDRASSLSLTDGRLLLFPVKSVKNVFAWITCPLVLKNFQEDISLCNGSVKMPSVPVDEKIVPHKSGLLIGDKVLLDEYAFKGIQESQEDGELTIFVKWLADFIVPKGPEYEYMRKKMVRDIVVLNDDEFRDFVNLSTEVNTRTNIDADKGTVKEGALFTEEFLPSESILYSLIMTSPIFKAKSDKVNYGIFSSILDKSENEQAESLMKTFKENMLPFIQMGGNATLGKGLISIKLMNERGGS